MLGLNSNGMASESDIVYDPEGRDTTKTIPKYNYDTLVHIIMWSLVLSLFGLLVYAKKHKGKQQEKHIEESIKDKQYNIKITEEEKEVMDEEDQ